MISGSGVASVSIAECALIKPEPDADEPSFMASAVFFRAFLTFSGVLALVQFGLIGVTSP